MCGLVGIISNNTIKRDWSIFFNMLRMNVIRGEHGTGVVRGTKTKHEKKTTYRTLFDKKDQTPDVFIQEALIENRPILDFDKDDVYYMGHCRAKTIGDINTKNCHPFNFKNIIGMHNGTIHGNYPNKKEFETDSEALFALINEVGFKEAINQFNQATYNPAWALTWYNKKEKSVNIYRNRQRPLWCAYSADEQTFLYSSNKYIIKAVTQEAKLRLETEPWELQPHHHLRFFINTDLLRWTGANSESETFVPTARVYSSSGWRGHNYPNNNTQIAHKKKHETTNAKNESTNAKRKTNEEGSNNSVQHLLPTILPFNPSNDNQSRNRSDAPVSSSHEHIEAAAREAFGEYSASPSEQKPDDSTFHSLVQAMNGRTETFTEHHGIDENYWLFTGPYNRILGLDEYQLCLNSGCAGCGEIPDVQKTIETTGEEPPIFWTAEIEYLCADCVEEWKDFLPPHVQHYISWYFEGDDKNNKHTKDDFNAPDTPPRPLIN